MELSVKSRLTLAAIMPNEGDYKTLVLKGDILQKIRLEQEEMTIIELVTTPKGMSWNPSKETPKEIEFTELESALIKAKLVELDTAKKLTDDAIDLYKLFN